VGEVEKHTSTKYEWHGRPRLYSRVQRFGPASTPYQCTQIFGVLTAACSTVIHVKVTSVANRSDTVRNVLVVLNYVGVSFRSHFGHRSGLRSGLYDMGLYDMGFYDMGLVAMIWGSTIWGSMSPDVKTKLSVWALAD